MSHIAIRVENLGKQYRIGKRERYRTLRDSLSDVISAPFRRLRGHVNGNGEPDHIWALKDVSFEIPRGEVVGVIGRNGAGKSTLLKVLSRITEPTEGHAEIHGRVGSLLEVGTGFHPELTGRENIYLNGAILGMKKAEIARKFDEIVAFAEIEKFLDTPVKHYSSGMYVRLAFAVAAHLEPDILVVDEVLAVGDLAFQKKCLGKMGDVAKGGRTIIFVSHQMNQIRRLCDRCLWLEDGNNRQIGPTPDVTASYETAANSASRDSRARPGSAIARFLSWEIVEPRSMRCNHLNTLGSLIVRFQLRVADCVQNGHHGVALCDKDGRLIWSTDARSLTLQPGTYHFLYTLPGLPLRPGTYFWRVSLHDCTGLVDYWECAPELVVATPPVTHSRDEWTGLLNIPYDLKVEHSKDTCLV